MANKQLSRSARWMNASLECQEALQVVKDAGAQLSSALEGLYDVQQEYQSWLDNLPDSLQSSAVADKLNSVCELDIETAKDDELDFSSIEDIIEEAAAMDLPMGFGRD